MLVLSRKKNESIVIDGKIRVHILGYRGGKIIVGVDAPKEVTVDREEVHLEKIAKGGDTP